MSAEPSRYLKEFDILGIQSKSILSPFPLSGDSSAKYVNQYQHELQKLSHP